ncbi:hypothetical protein [Mycoplasmopsis cynos]|uniref:hypothetical protein n=1 Tax=Mycoplasmopsis cynos TaxID=171284 RepID=UPI0021FA95F4|nr:hypothetical protein [Mycoplasmopsis cynos]UWV77252.1 hypothetical protein NW070_06105 [Mycoplasmopsis cynos]
MSISGLIWGTRNNIRLSKITRNGFKKHGFPKMIYSDKRRTFWGNENNQTAFEKILNEKGIEIKCSSNPTHKPHVERSFRTALDKYPVYIDKNNLKNLNDLRLNSDALEIITIQEIIN